MNFKEVISKYGYPFISKEVSECVDGARKYLKILTDRQTDRQTDDTLFFVCNRHIRGRQTDKQKQSEFSVNQKGEYP